MKLYVVITADTMFIERIVCHCILKTGCVHFSVSWVIWYFNNTACCFALSLKRNPEMFFLLHNRTLDLESGIQNMCPVLDHLITRHNNSEQISVVWWRVGWMGGIGVDISWGLVVGGWYVVGVKVPSTWMPKPNRTLFFINISVIHYTCQWLAAKHEVNKCNDFTKVIQKSKNEMVGFLQLKQLRTKTVKTVSSAAKT